MPGDLTDETPNHIRGWLGAHVESAVLHAAVELCLLASLLEGAKSCGELAEIHNYEQYSTRVIMDILVGLGIVVKGIDGYYDLANTLKTSFNQETNTVLAASIQGWQSLSSFSSLVYDALLKSAQAASSSEDTNKAQLLECTWKYVWSVGIIESGKHHLFSLLDKHPYSFSELAIQSRLSEDMLTQLCIAGQHTGIISLRSGLVELTQEARFAFGKGSMREYCGWMEQRLMMERKYFFPSLGMISHCVRSGQPASLNSFIGSPANNQFRRAFVRINRPLIPLLYHVAQKVVLALNIAKQPVRVLEIGAALGCWGIALASANQQSRIVSVDTPEALIETQHIVAATQVGGQYTWLPSDMRHIEEHEHHSYDLIVLNEICHAVPSTSLDSWLDHIVQQLSPDGTLLIADMVLDENYVGPFRHLLSAVKLLVTGGGHVLSINDYQQSLQRTGLEYIQLYRLATTDLIVASRKNFSLAL